MIKNIFEHERYQLIMLLAIFGYVLFSIPFPQVSGFFRALFLIGSLPIFFYYRNKIFQEPMFIMLGLAIVATIISWINSLSVIPQYAKDLPEIDRAARLFIFIPMAYWLRGKPKSIYLLFILFSASFILGMSIKSDFIDSFMRGLNGDRVDFDIKNAQYTSMFGGIFSILSLFGFCFFYLNSKKYEFTKIRLITALVLALFAIFFITITVISQSRMVFLGILMIAVLFPFLHKIAYGHKGAIKLIISYVATIVLISLVGYCLLPVILDRFNQSDTNTVQKLLNFDWNNIPMSNIGIRINSWIEASKWIADHPFIGVGERGPAAVIMLSQVFAERINEHYDIIVGLRHLHSFHMDALVTYGLFGFAILNGTYIVMLCSLVKLRNHIPHSEHWILLALCIVVYWLTINGFESFNFRTYGVLTHNVFMAAFYTFAITHHLFPTHTDETNNENRGSCQQS